MRVALIAWIQRVLEADHIVHRARIDGGNARAYASDARWAEVVERARVAREVRERNRLQHRVLIAVRRAGAKITNARVLEEVQPLSLAAAQPGGADRRQILVCVVVDVALALAHSEIQGVEAGKLESVAAVCRHRV